MLPSHATLPSLSQAISSPHAEIGGTVQRPLTLDVAALREFSRASIEPFDLVCFSTGRYIRPMGSYRGVQLRVLLDAAGVRRPDNTDFKRTVFLARGDAPTCAPGCPGCEDYGFCYPGNR